MGMAYKTLAGQGYDSRVIADTGVALWLPNGAYGVVRQSCLDLLCQKGKVVLHANLNL